MQKIQFELLSDKDKKQALLLIVAHYFSLGMFMSVQHHVKNRLIEGSPSLSELTLQMLFNIESTKGKFPFTTLNWVESFGEKRIRKLYKDIIVDQKVDMGENFKIFDELLIEKYSKINIDLAKNITNIMPNKMINMGCTLFLYYIKFEASKFKQIPADFLEYEAPFIALVIQSWFSEHILQPKNPGPISFARIQELENKMWTNDEYLKSNDLNSYLGNVLEDYKTVKKLDAYPISI